MQKGSCLSLTSILFGLHKLESVVLILTDSAEQVGQRPLNFIQTKFVGCYLTCRAIITPLFTMINKVFYYIHTQSNQCSVGRVPDFLLSLSSRSWDRTLGRSWSVSTFWQLSVETLDRLQVVWNTSEYSLLFVIDVGSPKQKFSRV